MHGTLLTLLFPVSYLSPGGNPGDILKGVAICDKSKSLVRVPHLPRGSLTQQPASRQDTGVHDGALLQQQRPAGGPRKPHKVRFPPSLVKVFVCRMLIRPRFVAGTDNELGEYVVPEEFSEVD